MKKKYCVVSSYNGLAVREIKYEDGKYKPISFYIYFYDIVYVDKKTAKTECSKLNIGDGFMTWNIHMYEVWEIKKL